MFPIPFIAPTLPRLPPPLVSLSIEKLCHCNIDNIDHVDGKDPLQGDVQYKGWGYLSDERHKINPNHCANTQSTQQPHQQVIQQCAISTAAYLYTNSSCDLYVFRVCTTKVHDENKPLLFL